MSNFWDSVQINDASSFVTIGTASYGVNAGGVIAKAAPGTVISFKVYATPNSQNAFKLAFYSDGGGMPQGMVSMTNNIAASAGYGSQYTLPSITMPSSGVVTGRFIAVDINNTTLTQGTSFSIDQITSQSTTSYDGAVSTPSCVFSPYPAMLKIGESVSVTPSVTGNPTSYSWDWGDGSTKTTGSGSKTHIYTKDGSFKITLTVSNTAGSSSVSHTVAIKPSSELSSPTCSFTPSKMTGYAGDTITFTPGSCTGMPTSFVWDFGDGSTGSGSGVISHTYGIAGSFTVKLTVSNAYGSYNTNKTLWIRESAVQSSGNGVSGGTDVGSPTVGGGDSSTSGGNGETPVIYQPDNTTTNTSGSSQTATTCNSTTCPSPGVCKNGLCTRVAASSTCVGMERDGEIDVTCALESGNEMYLYGAVGAIILLMMIRNR